MSGIRIPRLGIPTLGGRQFWGDTVFCRGWRIQHHVSTGRFRLIDARCRRFAAGTLEHCHNVLTAILNARPADVTSVQQQRAVILIHGIGRSSHCFASMARHLAADSFTVVPFEYPSTRARMERAAEYLHSVIQSLHEAARIDFVVHSMGGLVVRTWLLNHSDCRIGRMVMLGTPNQGAELAAQLRRRWLFRMILGDAGQQLATGADCSIQRLPVPPFEFGLIAGGRGNDQGYNPLLPGDDDGTVTVESVRLAGASDFLVVPRIHSFLMSDPAVIAATLHFLTHGRFDPVRPPAPVGSRSPGPAGSHSPD